MPGFLESIIKGLRFPTGPNMLFNSGQSWVREIKH